MTLVDRDAEDMGWIKPDSVQGEMEEAEEMEEVVDLETGADLEDEIEDAVGALAAVTDRGEILEEMTSVGVEIGGEHRGNPRPASNIGMLVILCTLDGLRQVLSS